MLLVDAYRSGKGLVLWLKSPENSRIERAFLATLYVEDIPSVRLLLERRGVSFSPSIRRTCLLEERRVLEVLVAPADFEGFVRWFERATKHRVAIYNADVTPEMQFLWSAGLSPLCRVDESFRVLESEPSVPLSSVRIEIFGKERVERIMMDDVTFVGEERELLARFAQRFISLDPDVLVVEHGFSRLPFLAARLEDCGVSCPLHRWDATPLRYRGGRSFFTYGQVRYQDYAIRLNGRFLVDTASTFGACSVDAIVELCQLAGGRLQQIASRSPGAVFQTALLRELYREGLLIPYKQLPLNDPVPMTELLKADRAGHTMDPLLGFHRNVAEVDFSSMFPWLMYNHNISAEQLLSSVPPFAYAPGLPIRISLARKGFVPRAIKPFLDRRMEYKKQLSSVGKERADALKAVLVSSNGYLRFREFKLGMARSHMALCAYARETLLVAKELAEGEGYTVVHGIVDSLYLRKRGMDEAGVRAFCAELSMQTGVPASFEGIFKWIVFLPSVNDIHRPVPARYFGAYPDGTVKARGVEVRQRGSPLVVREFQKECLVLMAACDTRAEIVALAPSLGRLLREAVEKLPAMSVEGLLRRVRVGRERYDREIPQREIMSALARRGVPVVPGQVVRFVHSARGAVLPEEYAGDVDTEAYERLLVRALFVLLQPFGFTRTDVYELCGKERQRKISEFIPCRFGRGGRSPQA